MSAQNELSKLFQAASLEDDAMQALTLSADNLGPTIMAGLGDVSIDEVEKMGATEVVLLVRAIDDSSSIDYEGNTDVVIEGENLLLDSLIGSKAASTILVATVLFNKGLVESFVPLERALRLDRNNYQPYGNTPLYDTAGLAFSMMVAKKTELENGGVTVRGITNLTSDGADIGSRTHRPTTVAAIARDMLRTESHIITAMGIDDHGQTDFRAVFGSMGVLDRWILTPGNSASEIRQAYGMVSQSIVRASRTAGSFSQTAMGGFGTDN